MASTAYTGTIRTLYATSAAKRLEYELNDTKELIKIKEKLNRIPNKKSESDSNNLNESTKFNVIDHLRKNKVDFMHDNHKDLENNIINNKSQIKYIPWNSITNESKVRII